MNHPTAQSPVTTEAENSKESNPYNLPSELWIELANVFATAAYAHKTEYLRRYQCLKDAQGNDEPDEKYIATLQSSRDFSERYLLKLGMTFKDLTGSGVWIEEVQQIIQTANQTA